MIADPFLGFIGKILWDNHQPDLKKGIRGTIWALQQAIDLNPGGIKGPVQLSTLKSGESGFETKEYSNTDLLEHQELLEEYVAYIKSFTDRFEEGRNEIPS